MPIHRRPAVLSTILLAGLSLVGCTAEPAPAPESAGPTERRAYLLQTATGPAEFTAQHPESPRLELFITCTLDSEFSIQVNDEANFFAGTCGAEAVSGVIPVHADSGDISISVVVPAETTFTVTASPAA